MSSPDPFAGMDEILFDEFGQDGSVQRGLGAPVPVRVVIDEGVERLGDYGQVVGRVAVASFMAPQWRPKQGDVLTVSAWSRPVASIDQDDGFVVRAVMHG